MYVRSLPLDKQDIAYSLTEDVRNKRIGVTRSVSDLQPGVIRCQSDVKPGRSDKRASQPNLYIKHESINYLERRRTDASKKALERNRKPVIVPEILRPSHSDVTLERHTFIHPTAITASIERSETILRVLSREWKQDKGIIQSSNLSQELDRLERQKEQIVLNAAETNLEAHRLYNEIRNRNIQLVYKFTPLFKIYAKHQMRPYWLQWISYVQWFDAETKRLSSQQMHIIRVQRLIRRRLERRRLKSYRLAIWWSEYKAASLVQRWWRHLLYTKEAAWKQTVNAITRMQSRWKGRKCRARLKKALQTDIRNLLLYISPNGTLHRLLDIAKGSQKNTKLLEYFLSLIVETKVELQTRTSPGQPPPDKSFIPAIQPTLPQLIQGLQALQYFVKRREREKESKKAIYRHDQSIKRYHADTGRMQQQANELRRTEMRLVEATERSLMARAEMEMKEYWRRLRQADVDAVRRKYLRQLRNEKAERELMQMEEAWMKYYLMETHRRKVDRQKREQELVKQKELREKALELNKKEMEELERVNEEKRLELQQRLEETKFRQREAWAELSKAEQHDMEVRAKARIQLGMEEEHRKRMLEDNIKAEEVQRLQEIERKRKVREEELEREQSERDAMLVEEMRCRQITWHEKKVKQAVGWKSKRVKEITKYALDPMQFEELRAQKEEEERERRELYLMKVEDVRDRAIHTIERKRRYLDECRERRRLKAIEEARERKETLCMTKQDEWCLKWREEQRRQEEYQRKLEEMRALATIEFEKRQRWLLEAHNRQCMHEEEMKQRRVDQARREIEKRRLKLEHERMTMEEMRSQQIEMAMRKDRDRWVRDRTLLGMLKEDALALCRSDWLKDGKRLEGLLWTPEDGAAFEYLIELHESVLLTNVHVFRSLTALEDAPPFDLDFDAVIKNQEQEFRLNEQQVPVRKRKPRRFFYHEFFEEDPILSALGPAKVVSFPEKSSAQIRAKERWKTLSDHFFPPVHFPNALKLGMHLMSCRKYEQAANVFRDAVCTAEAHGRKPMVKVIRQLARCYLCLWHVRADKRWLSKSLLYFQRMGSHMEMFGSPTYLQEYASVLEQMGSYQIAAKVLGGIVKCFPLYVRINEVIFRAGIILFALQQYHQSREYLLHVMDCAETGWKPHEMLFLVARILHCEGKASHKLSSVAFEDAYRKDIDGKPFDRFPTWKEWVQSPQTWREFGDLCFKKREFVIAKDAYTIMLKRTSGTSNSSPKRRTRKSNHEQRMDEDWHRLARASAMVHDQATTVYALKKWLKKHSYAASVEEKYRQWPKVRWKLLGISMRESMHDKKTSESATHNTAKSS